ncbi:MAG TPA: cell wall-binding repeat-containing protein [Acidimicrobiales bacterium]|nr:cell wall-binding repeat-containing protein [Acidimicrobiales bacterium]
MKLAKSDLVRRVAVTGVAVFAAVSGVTVLQAAPAVAAPAPVVLSSVAITRPASVVVGGSNQAATNWGFTFSNGFGAGDALVINLGPPGATSCQSSTNYVGFAGTPTVSVTAISSGQNTPPAFTATLAQQTSNPLEFLLCPGIKDQLKLTIGNAANNSATGSSNWTWAVTVSGITYNVGTGTGPGNVNVAASYVFAASGTTPLAVGLSPNAVVSAVGVFANNPQVLVQPNTTLDTSVNTAISPVILAETANAAIPAGQFVCIEMNAGNYFLTDSHLAPVGFAQTNAGSGAVLANSGGLTGFGAPSALGAFDTSGVAFQVTTASTTAGVFEVAGLRVVDPVSVPFGAQNLTVYSASSVANCASGTATAVYSYAISGFTVFNTNRISGSTADGTAAAELASVFPPAGSTCPSSGSVVLATDQNFPDALSASYLAAQLGTGVLLTPTAALSSVTSVALRLEGITHVYVVGGPLAVTDAVVNQVQSSQAFNCGGTTGITNASGPVNMVVTRVFGQTQYDTAQTVAQFFGAAAVGTGAFGGGYPTSLTGTSTYNTTSGLSGTLAPASSVATSTAILATGQTFPDAMAASAMSYAKKWPILLTTQGLLSSQASAAISNLGIKQVVVMGGPVAISDAVLTQLATLGVSVLRIAGADYTSTAQLLAQFELSTTANPSAQPTGLGWADLGVAPNTYGVNVARGDFYADALAGSVVGGVNHAPIVLTLNPTTLGTGIPALFTAEAGLTLPNQVNEVTVLGGPEAVTPATATAVLQAIANA